MALDWNHCFTDEDVEKYKLHFRSMPSYCTQDGQESISVDDIHNLAKVLGYTRMDGISQFESFWREKYNGRIPLPIVLDLASKQHDTNSMGKTCAQLFDTDGNGYISSDEFNHMLKMLKGHDPSMVVVSYEDFLKSADTNNDGKVSLEECAAWIDSNVVSNQQKDSTSQ